MATDSYMPRWVTLDGMNADELAAYDYGGTEVLDRLRRVLDGIDRGEGTSREPWESLRRRVLDLMRDPAEREREREARLREIARDLCREFGFPEPGR